MKNEEVARYLLDHPEFFESHADLLTRIAIPSPHGDGAISITERQMAALREKVKQLEAKLAELIGFGEENDAISSKVHKLAVALAGAPDRTGVLYALYSHLGGSFAVPHVAVRLWGSALGDESIEAAPVSDEARVFAETLTHPYCGPGAGPDVMGWFGDAGAHVRSLAFLALRSGSETFGLMVLGSEEPQRFYPGMGTLYLQQIGDLAAASLMRTRA